MDVFKNGDFSKVEIVDRKVHIISNSNPEVAMKKLEEFEKEHEIVDLKQPSPNLMFVFYYK